jgi:hypothetical protein
MFFKSIVKTTFYRFLIQIKLSSTSYICISCLHNINENKPSYQVQNMFFRNKIILSIQKSTQLEKLLISPRFVFVQI